MTSSSTRSSMPAVQCMCTGNAIITFFTCPMWQEMSLRTPDPLSTFRGRGLGMRRISIQAPMFQHMEWDWDSLSMCGSPRQKSPFGMRMRTHVCFATTALRRDISALQVKSWLYGQKLESLSIVTIDWSAMLERFSTREKGEVKAKTAHSKNMNYFQCKNFPICSIWPQCCSKTGAW